MSPFCPNNKFTNEGRGVNPADGVCGCTISLSSKFNRLGDADVAGDVDNVKVCVVHEKRNYYNKFQTLRNNISHFEVESVGLSPLINV